MEIICFGVKENTLGSNIFANIFKVFWCKTLERNKSYNNINIQLNWLKNGSSNDCVPINKYLDQN